MLIPFLALLLSLSIFATLFTVGLIYANPVEPNGPTIGTETEKEAPVYVPGSKTDSWNPNYPASAWSRVWIDARYEMKTFIDRTTEIGNKGDAHQRSV